MLIPSAVATVRCQVARWDEARVDERKIVDYLLAADHPGGGDKAAFFMSVGYQREEWTRLRDDLVALARRGGEITEYQTPFGTKYVVDGLIQSPDGRMVVLRTVWISDRPDDPPRLVTAYPV